MRLADHVAQRCLRRPIDSALIIGNVERRLHRIDDLPEENGVDIHRHRIFGERALGRECRSDDADIDPIGNCVDHRNDEEQPRPAQRMKPAEPQNDGARPLVGDLQRGSDKGRDEHDDKDECRTLPAGGAEKEIIEAEAGDRDDDEDDCRKSVPQPHDGNLRAGAGYLDLFRSETGRSPPRHSQQFAQTPEHDEARDQPGGDGDAASDDRDNTIAFQRKRETAEHRLKLIASGGRAHQRRYGA